ncbi:MAG: DUF480 domain-containing protein [Planctomycetaceae bacterium]
MEQENAEERNVIRTLTKPQRRVLGVLVEKAFTTKESYPLTLKATTTGCNQKSNRSPITNYSEDAVLDTLEELREMGLVGEVHTDGGRAPRYRHYMRKRFDFSEPQLATVTELLLRGRQQMGELRARASRMVQISGLSQLREELHGLLSEGFAQASGSLERRGIEVDHGFYADSEGKTLGLAEPAESAAPAPTPASSPAPAPPATSDSSDVAELKAQVEMLLEEHERLSNRVTELANDLDRVKQQAGF